MNRIKIKELPVEYLDIDFESGEWRQDFKQMIKKSNIIFLYSEDGSTIPNVPRNLELNQRETLAIFLNALNETISDYYLAKKIFLHDQIDSSALLILKRKN